MEKEHKPKKHRFQKAYTVHVISDSPDAKGRQYHFSAGASQALMMLSFLLLIAVVCYIIYSAISLHALRQLQDRQNALAKELQEQNTALSTANNALQNEVSQLSRAFNQKLEAEQAAEEAAHALTVPMGFPLTGSAAMTNEELEAEDGSTAPSLSFQNIEIGSAVIATGSGTVTEVSSSRRYGYCVVISHADGYSSVYYNGGVPMVSIGDEVAFGEELFRIAQGNASLQYLVQLNSSFIDPEDMLEING